MLLGSFSVYDMIFPEKVPEVYNLGFRSEKEWLTRNLNQNIEPKNWTEQQRWHALQPSLDLLDIVCPEVSEWVRENHKSGNIVYDFESDFTVGRFDFLNRKLILTRMFFQLRESEKSSTLAHEYRHSLQNHTKFMRRVIFQLLTGDSHEYLVEDEAELFESKVSIALQD